MLTRSLLCHTLYINVGNGYPGFHASHYVFRKYNFWENLYSGNILNENVFSKYNLM